MNFRAMLAMVLKIVVVLVALVIGVTVLRWTGEAFRAHTGLFLLLLTMMVLATGALARSVGKLPCRSKVKVIWIALICYLSFISFISFDFVRNELGKRYVSGYYSYYDCEDATPDDPCYFSSYRVNGHLSATIEGLGLLYIVACIACPWAAYRLWRNAQTNIETHDNDAQNAIKAARLLTEAEQGNAEAQEALGFFYCIGAGLPLDYVQAAKWFRKAAEQGNAEGQYRLGLSYYKGEGVPKDYAQAAFWWRKAAEQGEDTAQYNLKYLLHYKGEDVPQDYAKVALGYRKAAEQGDAEAQFNLGDLYYHGQGVPQDYAEAYFWFDLATAAEQDASLVKRTTKYRDEAASHLKPPDLTRVQERVREWFFDA
jgi:TPR repeat protein